VGPCTRSTPRDRFLEDSLHRFQVGDLRAHISQMRLGDDADLGARPLALVHEAQQRPHLADREPERPRATDEVQTLEVVDPVSFDSLPIAM
jgi:hypothetical protein